MRIVFDSFPGIDGYITPYISYKNLSGGGIILFVKKDIPSNSFAVENKEIDAMYSK